MSRNISYVKVFAEKWGNIDTLLPIMKYDEHMANLNGDTDEMIILRNCINIINNFQKGKMTESEARAEMLKWYKA